MAHALGTKILDRVDLVLTLGALAGIHNRCLRAGVVQGWPNSSFSLTVKYSLQPLSWTAYELRKVFTFVNLKKTKTKSKEESCSLRSEMGFKCASIHEVFLEHRRASTCLNVISSGNCISCETVPSWPFPEKLADLHCEWHRHVVTLGSRLQGCLFKRHEMGAAISFCPLLWWHILWPSFVSHPWPAPSFQKRTLWGGQRALAELFFPKSVNTFTMNSSALQAITSLCLDFKRGKTK